MVELKLLTLLALLMPFQEPTPSGTIAFTCKNEIWLVEANGENERIFIAGGQYYLESRVTPMEWSRDGSTLLYSRAVFDPNTPKGSRLEIRTTDLEGKHDRLVKSIITPVLITPRLSSDGKRVAYTQFEPPGLYVIDADGKNERLLSKNAHSNAVPYWSPDGKRIIFAGYDEKKEGSIFILHLESGNVMRAPFQAPERFEGDWSPDGKQFCYFVPRPRLKTAFVKNLTMLNPSTGTETELTNNQEDEESPKWSPDGTLIAYLTPFRTLSVVDAQGKNRRILAQLPGRSYGFSWSPDGCWLVYACGGPQQQPELFIVNMQGGKPRKLTGGGAMWPAWQPKPKS